MEETINERLRKIIEYYNDNPTSFAKSINVSNVTIRNNISGRNNPGYDLIIKICAKCKDINPTWFIFGTGKMLINDQIKYESSINFSFDKRTYDELINHYKNQIKIIPTR